MIDYLNLYKVKQTVDITSFQLIFRILTLTYQIQIYKIFELEQPITIYKQQFFHNQNFHRSFMKQGHFQNQQTSLLRLSLINNLKQKIETLNKQVEKQQSIIQNYKRSTKTTLINEQEIQIQKLNDQNKRLLLIVQELKGQMAKGNGFGRYGKSGITRLSSMNCYSSTKKKDGIQQCQPSEQHPTHSQKPPKKNSQPPLTSQPQYVQLLLETQKLRKQLIILKANESILKKKPLNERSSILMQNNINQTDKIKLKCYQLQAELKCKDEQNKELKHRVHQLQELLEQALQINQSMRII